MEKDIKWMQKMLDYAADLFSQKKVADDKKLYNAYKGIDINKAFKDMPLDKPKKYEQFNEFHIMNMKCMALEIPDLTEKQRGDVIEAKTIREIYEAIDLLQKPSPDKKEE